MWCKVCRDRFTIGGMIIPIDQLEASILTAIIEQFVLTEGTDYGEAIYSLEQKVAHVRGQLENASALLVYSELYETVTIMSQQEYENIRENQQI